MLKKLRIKFVVITMVIVTAMLGIIFGMLYHFTKSNLENESIAAMRSIADGPMHMERPDEFENHIRLPYLVLEVGKNGEILSSGSYQDLPEEGLNATIIKQVLASKKPTGVLKEYNMRYLRTFSPFGQSVVLVDMSAEQATLKDLAQTSLFIGAVSFVAFLGISILLANWVVRPVDKAWKQQQQFVSDASHELKTPLTVIMANAELLQEELSDGDSKKQSAGAIVTMSEQMRRLLEQMLQLARADNAQKPPHGAVSYSDLVSDGLLPFEPVFFEKGMVLESEIQPGIHVEGNETQLRQVLDILLDNAQKYAAQGGRTTVTLKRQARRCLLSVANDGAPIHKKDLENLFQRFYQADEARHHRGSFGLGLSIAESIVSQHKGKIWAESKGGRNTFFVDLPAKE